MRQKLFFSVLLGALLLVGAGCSSGTPGQAASPQATNVGQTYTMQEVQAASSAAKCWTIISGKVYDLTSFIGKHPGGPARILALCGTDGTAVFTQKHGGQPRPQYTLASYLIGTLK